MRTMKKTIAFVLAFAMAFATAFSAVGKGVTASAALSYTEVKPDGTFKIGGVSNELQVAVVTVKNGKASAIKSWDTYTPDGSGVVEGKITINPKKDTFVAFRTVGDDGISYSEPDFYEFKANKAKYKAAVEINDAGTGYKVSVKANGIAYDGKYTFNGVVDKTGDQQVTDDTTLNNGASIQIIPQGATSGVSASIAKVEYLGEECDVQGAVQVNAKAITAKIKKKANAPKASINYKTGVVTIPKGTMYRIINGDSGEWNNNFTEANDKKKVTIDTSGTLGTGVVQVYKQKTSKAIISKIGSTSFATPAALNVADGTAVVTLGTRNADKKTIQIANKTEAPIEYYVGTSVTETSKWITVKGTTATIKNTEESGTVWVRSAANAKEFKLPGKAASITWTAPAANNGGNTGGGDTGNGAGNTQP